MPRKKAPKVSFDGAAVREHFERLGHPESTVTEVWTSLDRQVGYFDDADALCTAVESLAGRGNVYIGVNPVSRRILRWTWAKRNQIAKAPHRTTKTHVHSITGLLLDIDVKTKARDHARKLVDLGPVSATNKERDAVLEAAQELIRREEWTCTLFCSGNGAQVLLPLTIDSDDHESRLAWEARFGLFRRDLVDTHDDLLGLGNGYGASLDSTFDSNRLMALAGVLKRKGRATGTRPHRMATIVERVGQLDPRANDDLVERLLEYDPQAVRSYRPITDVAKRAKMVRLKDAPFECELWNRFYSEGPVSPHHQRSGSLAALARKLVADRTDPERAVQILWNFDDTHFQKFSTRTDPAREYLQLLDAMEMASDLDCQAANRTFFGGDATLCDDCRWRGRLAKSQLVPAESDDRDEDDADEEEEDDELPSVQYVEDGSFIRKVIDLSRPIPLEEAREEIRDAITQYLAFSCHISDDGDEPPPVLLVKGPPGLGKSTMARELVAQNVSFVAPVTGKPNLRVTVLASYGAQMEEISRHFRDAGNPEIPAQRRARAGQPALAVKTIYGKEKGGLCSQVDRVRSVRGLEYWEHESMLTCRTCKDRGDCRYLGQFRDRDVSWLMNVRYAVTNRLREGLDNSPDIFVADEGLLELAVGDAVTYSAGALVRAADVIDECIRAGHPFSRAARALAEYVREYDDVMWGRLFRSELGEELPEIAQWLSDGFDDADAVTFLRDLPNRVEGQVLPKNVMPLLSSLHEDFRDDPPAGYVSVREDRLVVRRRNQFHFGDRPLIVLDSTGDEALYREILDRRVVVSAPKVDLACKVYQLGQRYSKTTLRQPRMFDPVLELIEAISERCNGKLAVVCVKELAPKVERRLKGKARVVRYYYGLRGSNEIEEAGCTDIVLMGAANPNLEDLAERVQALDRQIRSPAIEMRELEYDGRDDEGYNWFATMPMPRDEQVERWCFQAREAEMVQAAFRLRPLDNPETKTIWILTAYPLPGLMPNRLFQTREEMLQFVRESDP